jgi:uncharacterized protein YjiS (DUF1127 family)
MIKRLFEKIAKSRQRTADLFILHNLSDKELRDIGITRGEIVQRVYENKTS